MGYFVKTLPIDNRGAVKFVLNIGDDRHIIYIHTYKVLNDDYCYILNESGYDEYFVSMLEAIGKLKIKLQKNKKIKPYDLTFFDEISQTELAKIILGGELIS